MTPQSAKAKGRGLQNRVARMIADAAGLKCGSPGDENADITGRQMSQPGLDIVCQSEAARRAWVWPTYCRCAESWTRHPLKAMAEGRFEPARWWAEELPVARAAWQREPVLYVFSAARERLYVISAPWATSPGRKWFQVRGEVSDHLWALEEFDADLVAELVRRAGLPGGAYVSA